MKIAYCKREKPTARAHTDLHDLGADDGCEGTVVIGQVREGHAAKCARGGGHRGGLHGPGRAGEGRACLTKHRSKYFGVCWCVGSVCERCGDSLGTLVSETLTVGTAVGSSAVLPDPLPDPVVPNQSFWGFLWGGGSLPAYFRGKPQCCNQKPFLNSRTHIIWYELENSYYSVLNRERSSHNSYRRR
eukprot:1188312-Prorocentrum_minimum.AAC.3